MTTSDKIKALCQLNGISISKLAELLGMSNPNLFNKLKRGNFPENELKQIAEALGCEYESHFITKDGTKI